MLIWRAAVALACLLLSATTWPPTSLHRDHSLSGTHLVRLADAEQARADGGLIALYPRPADAQTLAIPGGEALDDLHLSLVEFPKDVRGFSDDALMQRLQALMAGPSHPIEAQVFGRAVLNPDHGPSGAAAVYLVGDSTDLASLQQRVVQLSERATPPPNLHDPWLAHITASYGLSDLFLTYTGPVVFDRIGLSWAGHITYFPLGPS